YFRKGYSPQRIAEARGLVISTISGHIASLIQSGEITSLDMLVEEQKIAPIREAFMKFGFATLSQTKEYLGGEYSYEDLRFVRAFDERKRNSPNVIAVVAFLISVCLGVFGCGRSDQVTSGRTHIKLVHFNLDQNEL